MKPLVVISLVFIASGCAENTPPAEVVREHFEQGLSGQGRIVPLDNPEEPIPKPEDRPH
jgi:hypothetical protein